MVSFHCFRDGKCEWNKGLKDFADQFNKTYEKDYSLSKCLDISKKETKQPEVLLEASGDQSMVIECKQIVYPKDYYQKHRHFHDFFSSFQKAFERDLRNALPEDLYQITINESILYQNPKSKLDGLSREITLYIKNNLEDFLISNIIFINKPIPCCFRRIPDNERDDTSDKSGLKLSGSWKDTAIYYKEMMEAEPVISQELARHLANTEKKFQEYIDCVKILIVEIGGDFLFPEKIIEIIENANIPPIIDQIWLADPEDESENIVTYHRVV
jgi:hypothetical protein